MFGMSTRQLERLFRRYLNRSPKRCYMELRLGQGRASLADADRHERRGINLAVACGFAIVPRISRKF